MGVGMLCARESVMGGEWGDCCIVVASKLSCWLPVPHRLARRGGDGVICHHTHDLLPYCPYDTFAIITLSDCFAELLKCNKFSCCGMLRKWTHLWWSTRIWKEMVEVALQKQVRGWCVWE
jgi:hypothetical protein